MSKRNREDVEGGAPQIEHEYEGEAVLAELLKAAGAAVTVAEAIELVRNAQAEHMGADEAFPDLFDKEPRFASQQAARRLYANLFGLWDRVKAGGLIEPMKGETSVALAGRDRAPEPPQPIEGPLTDAFVDAAWKHLADLPARQSERLLHRWENTQPELTEAVRLEAGDDVDVLENADTLAFEIWCMLELAQPQRRIRPVALRELQAELDSSQMPEPALERYIDEAIEDAKGDETAPLSDEHAERIGRIARAVVRALCKAL